MMQHLVELQHVTKVFAGVEQSLRGTKLEAKGPALWLRNLSRLARLTADTAPPVHALADISLSVAPDTIFGLVGRNGTGKTTLLKILAGLIRPTSGTGQVAGIPLTDPAEIRRRVSYVSTTGWMGLEWPLTAEENVRFFAALCGMSARLARCRTEEALRDVELWGERHKYPAQLSNGMRQRVILARALLFRTPLVLLDEPTVGLDPVTTQTILALIKVRLRERGQTIIVTDHQSAEMAQLADQLAVLRDGRIALQGTPAELLALLHGVTVIEVQTAGMDLPAEPPPDLLLSSRWEERPGALGIRVWHILARADAHTVAAVLDWIAQPAQPLAGQVVLLAESPPQLADVLAWLEQPPTASSPEAEVRR